MRSAWDEQRGAEIDKQNSKGFTALTAAAASQGHEWVLAAAFVCRETERPPCRECAVSAPV